jgi:hypothetical protein
LYFSEATLCIYQFSISCNFRVLGLYAAAYDLGIEWAVIKGVSNFADGSKKSTEKWQQFATAMAASVVHNMFKYPDVIKQWPHYKKAASVPSVARGNGLFFLREFQ